jgi:uncharacterized protein YdhG (YjbR/CyaY superfamily)
MATNEIDQYITQFPAEVREKLEEIRFIIQQAAPMAEEVISYKMPAYDCHGILVYFAGYKKHVGFYPSSSGIEAFQHEFGPYKWSKGAVQFPLDQPLPADLITRIVAFRIQYNLEMLAAKKTQKKKTEKI